MCSLLNSNIEVNHLNKFITAQDAGVSLISGGGTSKAKILFLGYAPHETSLFDELIKAGCEVWHTGGKIQSTIGYDLVISYGYRYILRKEIIDSSSVPIVNLHISYLPWNRGAHPNFWSFYDCTPSGVTIHLIDDGIDTGPILFQRYVNFGPLETTFADTYYRLKIEIEELFREHLEVIVSRNFLAIPQRRKGSFHLASDLPEDFQGWHCDIQTEINRLDSLKLDK